MRLQINHRNIANWLHYWVGVLLVERLLLASDILHLSRNWIFFFYYDNLEKYKKIYLKNIWSIRYRFCFLNMCLYQWFQCEETWNETIWDLSRELTAMLCSPSRLKLRRALLMTCFLNISNNNVFSILDVYSKDSASTTNSMFIPCRDMSSNAFPPPSLDMDNSIVYVAELKRSSFMKYIRVAALDAATTPRQRLL